MKNNLESTRVTNESKSGGSGVTESKVGYSGVLQDSMGNNLKASWVMEVAMRSSPEAQ